MATTEAQIDELRAQFAQLYSQRGETLNLLQQDSSDEDVRGLLNDIEEEIARIVDPLNRHDASLGFDTGQLVQVQWDDGNWYTCRIVRASVPDKCSRLLFLVNIIGYKIEEECHAERLRRWKPSEVPLTVGMTCYAVHSSGMFFEATIDKVSPNNTVWVRFSSPNIENGYMELPLTHIHLGKHYRELKKKHTLTDAERQTRAEQNRKRKRERAQVKKELRSGLIEQNAADWRGLLDDLREPQPVRQKQEPPGK